MLNRTFEMIIKEIDWKNPVVVPPAIYTYPAPTTKDEFVKYVIETVSDNVPDISTDPVISEQGRVTKLAWHNESEQVILEIIIFWASKTDTFQHYTGLFYFKRKRELEPKRQFKFKFIAW